MEFEKVVTRKEKFQLKYILADFGVRYWEDTEVNGVEDDASNPTIPCTVDTGRKIIGGRRWIIKVNVDNGQIVNWTKGVTADVHYKVCDDGTYTLLDENDNTIQEIESYVPRIFAIDDNGYGDYVIMKIDADGFIKNWKFTHDDLDEMIRNDFEYKCETE